jgi:threonine dehydratase
MPDRSYDFDPFHPELEELRTTRNRLLPSIRSLPLLRIGGNDRDIRLKVESLQPLGSFKIRGGITAAAEAAKAGATCLITASAGNFAQGLTLGAQLCNLPVEVHVPDSAARIKVEAIKASGAFVVEHCFTDWWNIMQTRQTENAPRGAKFIHPVAERSVLLGNATIGLEIAEEWPEVDVVIAPFGGGGLCVGIAAALQALGVSAEIVAAEVSGSAALSAALSAGGPTLIDRTPSFVDGIGSTRVLDEMWPLISAFIGRSVVVPIEECAGALREIAFSHKLVVEGAAATAYAAAHRPEFAGARITVVLSGSNIDPEVFVDLMRQRG